MGLDRVQNWVTATAFGLVLLPGCVRPMPTADVESVVDANRNRASQTLEPSIPDDNEDVVNSNQGELGPFWDLPQDDDDISSGADLDPNNSEDFVGSDPTSDVDYDTIPDKIDTCPTDYEDLDGEEDCPELVIVVSDDDNDGVYNEIDDCPNKPEDWDGVEDEDGCPEDEVD